MGSPGGLPFCRSFFARSALPVCGGLCRFEVRPLWTGPEALGALFSGWAFVAMFFALRMQSEELALQRAELEATRAELRRTAKANEDSAELARKSVRAQYLMYWLEKNGPDYQKEINNYLMALFEAADTRKLLKKKPHDSYASDCLFDQEMAKVRAKAAVDEYIQYEAELDSLTKSILPPTTSPADSEAAMGERREPPLRH